MPYITPDGFYPAHYGDIQIQQPDWKKGDPLPEGWVEVAEVPVPNVAQDEVFYEGFPKEVKGVMTQNWEIRKMTPEEIERTNAPVTLNEKLTELGLTQAEIEYLLRKYGV